MKQNKKLIPLWIIFLIYSFCLVTMKMNFWVLLSVWASGLAVFLLIKTKLPSEKGIIISVVFAVLVSAAYLGIRAEVSSLIFNGLLNGVPTLLCSLAIFSVKEKCGGIKIISTDKKYSPLISILIAVAAASVLSVINYFLMRNSSTADFGITASRLMVCLSPAIYEEMVCRAIFLAYCVYITGSEKPTKFLTFTMWFMMCLPHTAAHGYDIGSTAVLCILFGLPFAFLQRKRDISSAMISHGLVDAVRFTIFGIGM